MFNMDLWNDDAKYAIFDDYEDWKKFYNYKCWLGAQLEFSITDKYKRKKNIKWGKPSIVLSNIDPDFSDQQWIKKNCVVYFMKDDELFY